jgi:hypothetical protein
MTGVDRAVDDLVEWVQTVRYDMRIDSAGLDAALRGLLDDLLLEDELGDDE